MRILIANKFYYNRGGDCVASISLEKLLQEKGHHVAFFSMQHPSNFKSEWSSFFPSFVDFQSNNWNNRYKAAIRIFYSNEVKKKFLLLLEEFKPDIIHLNNIHSQLSPLIGEIAHNKGLKVIWTLHDYKLICPAYSCLNNGNICEKCIENGNTAPVISNRCMKNSFLASCLAYAESRFWNRKRLITHTDYFIAPSAFMKRMMIKGDFPENKIKVIPNFINRELLPKLYPKENYFCFIGRLSSEKGLETLIKAANKLPYQLVIIGGGPLEAKLKAMASSNVHFAGVKQWDEIKEIVGKARFCVIPSEWYENNPISAIEAQCLGTPILGANIGGIPETITENQSGLLFKSGNADDLKEKIQLMYQTDFNHELISREAKERFSAEKYYNEIIKIYEQ